MAPKLNYAPSAENGFPFLNFLTRKEPRARSARCATTSDQEEHITSTHRCHPIPPILGGSGGVLRRSANTFATYANQDILVLTANRLGACSSRCRSMARPTLFRILTSMLYSPMVLYCSAATIKQATAHNVRPLRRVGMEITACVLSS